jgi:hypothetical protein
MSQFDSIRPFYDAEVNAAIREIVDDSMLAAIYLSRGPKSVLERAHEAHPFVTGFSNQLYLSRRKESFGNEF